MGFGRVGGKVCVWEWCGRRGRVYRMLTIARMKLYSDNTHLFLYCKQLGSEVRAQLLSVTFEFER